LTNQTKDLKESKDPKITDKIDEEQRSVSKQTKTNKENTKMDDAIEAGMSLYTTYARVVEFTDLFSSCMLLY
jgi:hypothetical protein